ncbi:MATE family efflux transporter [Vaginisenegalia massiliensis]|uniref:MATE family efflux transporter n=1 Tax=Vaginisenegalia massiliensis TaxID=2058294 RepID=UPI000F542C15|nr:MATE family efflux transporter [Vaginisenegalia massiliensis]
MYPTDNRRQRIGLLIKILFPILIYQLSNFSAQFIDAMMTGQYNETHLAGVAIGSSIWSPFFALLTGISSGLIPIVSRDLGAGNKDKLASHLRQYLYLGLILCILFYLIGSVILTLALNMMSAEAEVETIAKDYILFLSIGLIPAMLFSIFRSFIDGLGFTRISMAFMLLMLPFNSGLNYLFIYGKFGFKAMGGAGAGLGTALAFWLVLFVVLAVIQWHPKIKEYHIFESEPISWRQMLSSLQVGFPIGLSVFAEAGVFCFVGILMTEYSAQVIAAHQASLNFSNFMYSFPLSISTALTIAIGYELGRRDIKAIKSYSIIGISISLLLTIGTLLFLFVYREQVAKLYGNNPAFIKLAIQFLTVGLLFQFSDAVNSPIIGILRGYKDTKWPFLLSLIGFWLVGLPLGFALKFWTNLGPFSYWWGLIIGLFVGAVLNTGRLIYVIKHRSDFLSF